VKKRSENVVNKLLPVLSQTLRGRKVTSVVLSPTPTKNRGVRAASKASEIGVGGPCRLGSVGFSHRSILYKYSVNMFIIFVSAGVLDFPLVGDTTVHLPLQHCSVFDGGLFRLKFLGISPISITFHYL